MMWQAEGLQPPKSVTNATNAYRSDMDTIEQFLKDCCTVVDDNSVKVKVGDLYKAFQTWSSDAGEHAPNMRRFNDRLRERGFRRSETKENNVYWWFGVGLNSTENDPRGEM